MRRITSNKEIVLGVTGSIAAYKACDLASRLVGMGARVTPVLTQSALELVGAASFEAITGQRAITRMFEPLQNPDIEHIAIAARAHLFLIAPATANILAKAAHGIADDWLTTTLLATRAPVLFAPAMNTNMYSHPATQENIKILQARGCFFVGPASGRLACGAEGIGRMAEPQDIIEAAIPLLSSQRELTGKSVVITSGPTREPIDPVRYLGNRSSGKMGRAVAMEALARGAHVTVVTGPAEIPLPYGAEVVHVETAAQMAESVVSLAQECNVFIAVAAVADYRAETPLDRKRKRTGKPLVLQLVENPDLLALVGAVKKQGQIMVGFAAETHDLIRHAQAKLADKNLDLIVANEVGKPDAGFAADTTRACVIGRDDPAPQPAMMSKEELAEKLFDRVALLLK